MPCPPPSSPSRSTTVTNTDTDTDTDTVAATATATATSMGRRSGIAWLVCLLVLAAFTHHADAARPRHLRAPQVVLPPQWGGGGGGGDGVDTSDGPRDLGERVFTLRHIYHHGSHKYPLLHRYLDISPDEPLRVTADDGETIEEAATELRAQAVTTTIQRLAARNKTDIDDLLAEAAWYGRAAELAASAWTSDEIAGPNVSDKSTVVTFAKMAANAYVQSRRDGEWLPVKGGFNYTDDFGWQTDGLRGHIFADETNSTVVIGLKGTSPAVFDGADTTGNDKLNDNLFGSCCCGQGGQYLWKQVCDCMTGTYQCNSTCLVQSLQQKSHYYWAVRDLYHNVTARYPNSSVWLSGHSLGGVVSSLLGLTYGLPTMTFEAFPDAMAASRLGLPTPPGYQIGSHQSRADVQLHHFGHTADPIYMGTCNAASSFCTIAGYAFQGVCHTGKTCTYDTVGDLGWRVGLGTHKIVNVIRDVLEKYDTVPDCETDTECVDCYNWKFYESNGTESTTTSKSSTATSTRTRTETCKTPGWWGCLDESTTTTSTTTTSSSTSSTSTSTCKTPGWFGCKDETTTTTTSTITMTSAAPGSTTTVVTTTSTSTSTCHTPGWFGRCDDLPTTTTSATPQPSHTSSPAPSTTSGAEGDDDCTSREWFGLICVDPSSPSTKSVKSQPPGMPRAKRRLCVERYWYGSCKKWGGEEDVRDAHSDLR